MKPKIGIISFENDLHALVIEKLLNNQWGVECHYIEFDKLAGSDCIEWNLNGCQTDAQVRSRCGEISVSSLDLIWWRRTTPTQLHSRLFSDEAVTDLINKDSRDALIGALCTTFKGEWVSHPFSTLQASNKLRQLAAAHSCGLKTPKTLITQSVTNLRRFYDELNGNVIVKPVSGTNKQVLYTRMLCTKDFDDPESIECVPMMYQECIGGADHFRVNVFGDSIIAFRIESNDLDWRGSLVRPVEVATLPAIVKQKVLATLRNLELSMGIVDIKLDGNGEYHWFEVNPQGQFLFLEGLTGFDLKNTFCKFLVESAVQRKEAPNNSFKPTGHASGVLS